MVPPLLALRTMEPVDTGEEVAVLELVEVGVARAVEEAEALTLVMLGVKEGEALWLGVSVTELVLLRVALTQAVLLWVHLKERVEVGVVAAVRVAPRALPTRIMLGVPLEVKEAVVEREGLHTVEVGEGREEGVRVPVGEVEGVREMSSAAGEPEMAGLREAPEVGETPASVTRGELEGEALSVPLAQGLAVGVEDLQRVAVGEEESVARMGEMVCVTVEVCECEARAVRESVPEAEVEGVREGVAQAVGVGTGAVGVFCALGEAGEGDCAGERGGEGVRLPVAQGLGELERECVAEAAPEGEGVEVALAHCVGERVSVGEEEGEGVAAASEGVDASAGEGEGASEGEDTSEGVAPAEREATRERVGAAREGESVGEALWLRVPAGEEECEGEALAHCVTERVRERERVTQAVGVAVGEAESVAQAVEEALGPLVRVAE